MQRLMLVLVASFLCYMPATADDGPPASAKSATIASDVTYSKAFLVIWYDGSIRDKEAIFVQTQLRECVKIEARNTGLNFFEYDISVDVVLNKDPMSQRQYFLTSVPRAKVYLDNCAAGEVVVGRVKVTKDDCAIFSYPLCISQAGGIEDQLALLMKPILSFAKKPGTSTTAKAQQQQTSGNAKLGTNNEPKQAQK